VAVLGVPASDEARFLDRLDALVDGGGFASAESTAAERPC
jgi:hypothetical protein